MELKEGSRRPLFHFTMAANRINHSPYMETYQVTVSALICEFSFFQKGYRWTAEY